MTLDPRTPVIVGVGQSIAREESDELSPLALMREASAAALADTAAGEIAKRVQSVAVVECFSWPVPDPARALAAELGIEPAETVRTTIGGNSPLALLADVCERIAGGELGCALLAGGEAMTPFMHAARGGDPPDWPKQDEGTEPNRLVGTDRPGNHAAEMAAALIAPLSYYPLFENAVRGSAGRTVEEQTDRIGRLWARLAAVAADNPYAWTRDAPSAETIATPSEDNRMAAFPYTKLLTANIQVNQGAAAVVCSAEVAEAAGVPRERWVFVRSSAGAHDHWFAGERERLDGSPAIAATGRAALAGAGLGVDDLAHLDLYSCFPSAVEIAAAELGLDLEADSRPPTVTGGLTFAGGPVNNYCSHSVAAMTERLRETGGSGLLTGLGWYVTKHTHTVLSAEPPDNSFSHRDVQAEVDALPKREFADAVRGSAEIETYTSLYQRDGTPSVGIISALLEDGSRAFAKSSDQSTLEALLSEDPLGETVELDPEPGFALVPSATVS